MKYVFIDYETRSRVDLRKSNPYHYSEDAQFKPLILAWSEDAESITVETDVDVMRSKLLEWLADDEVLLVAHNAEFELVVSSRVVYPNDYHKFLPPEKFVDTASIASELGWPRKLEFLAQALGTTEKLASGSHLINLFCKPNRKGGFNDHTTHLDQWIEFEAYAEQDVRALIEVFERLGSGWPNEHERQIWNADQRINQTGVRVDLSFTAAAAAADISNRVNTLATMNEITGLANANSNTQMLGWLKEGGVHLFNMQKETVAELLKGDLKAEQREVLELRRGLALTAPKKYGATLSSMCSDGRLRGQFKFFGAHTGRWSGQDVQLQNLTRETLKPSAEFEAKLAASNLSPKEEDRLRVEEINRLTESAILDVKMGLGADQNTLKCLVRGMYVGPFMVADYSAIEARVVAWLAGEQWVLDAFNAGKDIYVETAERMSTAQKKMTRFDGKVATLALGFGGAVGALERMGATGSDQELAQLVKQWRKANPLIVRFWYDLERVFKQGGQAGRIVVEAHGPNRHMILPSGRTIIYRNVKARSIATEYGPKSVLSFADPTRGRTDTWYGKLCENAVQAVARDIMAGALVRLDQQGIKVVWHVHDEIIAEDCTVDDLVKFMTEPEEWMDGLPIGAEGEGPLLRYRKL